MANVNFVAWEKLFVDLNIDTSKELHIVSTKQIKQITKREPRLMAKMDSSKDVPPVMARHGYFLLPISRSEYAIVRGKGFHELEKRSQAAKEFVSRIRFNLVTNGRNTSEMQYLDYCANAGLIEEVVGKGKLYPMIRGREGSGTYSFRVGRTGLDVRSAQIEVDLGLEGRDSIVLLEAKSKTPDDFIIRQLFYPYRKFMGGFADKQIIPIFFTYDSEDERYNFWKYHFTDPSAYNSIQLVEQGSYKIKQVNVLDIEDITEDEFQIGHQKDLIPQANDLDKVLRLIHLVGEGVVTANEIAREFGFAPRQSSYYREAAEALGFISLDGREYSLTAAGKLLVSLNTEKRNTFFAKAINEFALFKECMDRLRSKGLLTRSDIEMIIAHTSNLSGTTIPRRARSIEACLRWMSVKTGTFKEENRVFIIEGEKL